MMKVPQLEGSTGGRLRRGEIGKWICGKRGWLWSGYDVAVVSVCGWGCVGVVRGRCGGCRMKGSARGRFRRWKVPQDEGSEVEGSAKEGSA